MPSEILILSDSHLFDSAEKELFGVNTHQALDKVTGRIRDKGIMYDLMIASGDISEDGSQISYEQFHNLTKNLALNTVWMTGNHDTFSNIPGDLGVKYLHEEWHLGQWSMIFLDSSIRGKDEGYLEQKELQRLEVFFHDHKNRHVLIFMHHQPLDVGSEFIDELGLQNKDAFWKVARDHQHLKAVLFGHVHQESDRYHNNVRVLSTPSTAIQFKPFSRKLNFDEAAFCYRTITLNENGTMETLTHRKLANF